VLRSVLRSRRAPLRPGERLVRVPKSREAEVRQFVGDKKAEDAARKNAARNGHASTEDHPAAETSLAFPRHANPRRAERDRSRQRRPGDALTGPMTRSSLDLVQSRSGCYRTPRGAASRGLTQPRRCIKCWRKECSRLQVHERAVPSRCWRSLPHYERPVAAALDYDPVRATARRPLDDARAGAPVSGRVKKSRATRALTWARSKTRLSSLA